MVIFDLLTRNTEIDQTGLTLYVAVGEELETGVVVEKVERRSVALRKNGESKVYRLKWE